MSGPLIGLTVNRLDALRGGGWSRFTVSENYVRSILRAGGVPLLIPHGLSGEDYDVVCASLDGLLITGGGDINPVIFNGKPHPRVSYVDDGRDELEINLTKRATQEGIPFLGICRGIQVINVALGGTLFTDLADQLPGALTHDQHNYGQAENYLAHPIEIVQNSKLAQILGPGTALVNSMHHQGVEYLAPGTVAMAKAPDNLVEAIELTGHPFGLGVQWHPECLPDSVPMQMIFKSLVSAASNS